MNQQICPYIAVIVPSIMLLLTCIRCEHSIPSSVVQLRQTEGWIQEETTHERTIFPNPVNKSQLKEHEWLPATYRGLTVGRSTIDDTLLVFGEPTRSFLPDEPDQIWYEYRNVAEFPGIFTIAVEQQGGRILEMFLSLQDLLSKEAAVSHFGGDYRITRYDFCENLVDQEPPPLYESPHGAFTYIEYRSRGIALALNDRGQVYTVHYVSKPIGFKSSADCKRKRKQ